MRPLALFLIASLIILAAATSSGRAAAGQQLPNSKTRSYSAADFDWHEMVPYLFAAATLPGEQGLKTVLEHSRVLRVYVANELGSECRADNRRCFGGSATLDEQVSKRIDQIVQEEAIHRHKAVIVDFPFSRQPFPFSEIAASKSDKHPDAYLMLALSDHSYTAADLQAKYGAPYDTDIFQWYSVFKYRVEDSRYTSKAIFEVDPTDGAVIKVAISVKPKKQKKRN